MDNRGIVHIVLKRVEPDLCDEVSCRFRVGWANGIDNRGKRIRLFCCSRHDCDNWVRLPGDPPKEIS